MASEFKTETTAWYVGAQNDGLYIIDHPPRPSTDDINPEQDVSVIAKVYDANDWLITKERADLIAEAGTVLHETGMGPRELSARVKVLEHACSKQNDEVCQTLGKSLGFLWFKDDQKNFPGATKENGVCVGEHVAESIAESASKRIRVLEGERAELIAALKESRSTLLCSYDYSLGESCVVSMVARLEVLITKLEGAAT